MIGAGTARPRKFRVLPMAQGTSRPRPKITNNQSAAERTIGSAGFCAFVSEDVPS